jgi:hypothetical protein
VKVASENESIRFLGLGKATSVFGGEAGYPRPTEYIDSLGRI